jgi:hypothetical protein
LKCLSLADEERDEPSEVDYARRSALVMVEKLTEGVDWVVECDRGIIGDGDDLA